MKNRIGNSIRGAWVLGCLTLAVASCEYKEIADADYPEQVIYMPAAKSGIYTVDEIAESDAPFRYEIDLSAQKVIIPLAVYRAGIHNKGSISAAIEADRDTVSRLIGSGDLTGEDGRTAELLPEGKYTLPESVRIADGAETAKIPLAIDLPFLLEQVGKRFAIGVKLLHADVKINESLNTVIVNFSSDFLQPRPGFTYSVPEKNGLTVTFANTTQFGVAYEWDFGDGSPVSTVETPVPHTYPSLGAYTVRLTVEGVSGKNVEYTQVVHLWDDITDQYILNPGPFRRSDKPTGKVGILQDWSYSPNVLASNGKGGYYMENGGVMDFYSTTGLTNAKIYQSFELAAGTYRAAFVPYEFKGTNECYYVVATGDAIPDIENLKGNPAVLGMFHWNEDIGQTEQGMDFEVKPGQKVTLGFVVTNQAKSRLKISSVALYR